MQLATARPSPTEAVATQPAGADPGPALRLAAYLDAAAADPLLGELQQRIARRDSIRLDGTDVERIATQCVQVLVAAALAARAHGLLFRVEAPSAALSGALGDLGLRAELGMADV